MLSLTYWPTVKRSDGPAGIVVFCFGPLPQERARVRITAVKPKYAIGQLVRILVPSPYRTTPFCSVFGTCGGCQLQHLSYPAQLAWKTDTVRSALQRIGGFHDAGVRDAVGMTHPRAYRNKMSLVVEHRGGTPTIGFYKQRSHEVVPIDSCPIVTPQLSDYDRAPQSGTDPAGGQRSARGYTTRRRA